jgi:hypothetical protein
MKETIEIWIDKNDDLFFENYLRAGDADALKKFLEEELGYDVIVSKDNTKVFKQYPAIWKKKVVRDIDWSNYNNILYIIKNRNKSDIEIVEALHSEGSGFSITIKRGIVMTEYSKFLEQEKGQVSDEQLVSLAKLITNQFMKGKKISVGTNIIFTDEGKKLKGTILEYDGGSYTIKDEEGYKRIMKRSEFDIN